MPDDVDQRIAELVAERIPDGACVQAGIGSIPNGVLAALGGHRELGIHTELLSDGVIDLVERGVVTGVRKVRRPGKVVTTFALGTRRLYDFLDGNPAVELLPVDWVNDPRVIAQEPASSRSTPPPRSTSSARRPRRRSPAGTGRAAAARPTSPAAPCTPTAARASSCSARPPPAAPCRASCRACREGSAVTTSRTPSTRWSPSTASPSSGAAAIRERTHALVAIADPQFRDDLEASARTLGWW